MPVKEEIIRAALQGQNILPRLGGEALAAVEATLTAALLHPRAQAYADYLEGEPLAAAEAEAAPYIEAVEAAQRELAREEASITAKLAAFWQRKREDPNDPEREPPRETPRVRELRQALTEAEQRAFPYKNVIRIIGYQVDALRGTPRPDCVVLERLGLGVNRPCPDAEDLS